MSHYWNLDYEEVKESAKRCQACAGIVNFLNAQKLEPIKLDYHGDHHIGMTVNLRFAGERHSPTYEFFVENQEPTEKERILPGLNLNWSKVQRMRAPSGDTSSKAAFKTLQQWISRCQAEHTQCHPATDKTLPYRVLEIESTEPIRIRLVESCTRDANYACLSHRWSPQTKSNSLNKENLDLYKAEVPENKLYPLVRDAIAAIIKLDLRFIWIDCYCIIQDDPKDWEEQAANMARIYENALLTISATFSEDGHGIFSTIPSGFEAVQVTEIVDEPVYVRKQLPHPCTIDRLDQEHVHGLSLTRAWVFQERLLSNRFIHFTKSEIFWECRESTWCECNSGKVKWESRRIHRPRTTRNQEWNIIAEQYNLTQLTFEKDRLPALAGVAHRYAELLGGLTYLSGLWEECLPSTLGWHKSAWNEKRPLKQFAPTWSWVSLPRGKDLSTGPIIASVEGSMRLVSYKINPPGADVYAGAKWTELTIEGSTLDLTVYKESDKVLIGRHGDAFLKLAPDFKIDPDNDTEFRAVRNGSRCLLLLLVDRFERHVSHDVFGIVLLPQNGSADGEDAKFERIGYIGSRGFKVSYVDLFFTYYWYCGGRFPPLSDRKHFSYPPTYEWLLRRVKKRKVTLV